VADFLKPATLCQPIIRLNFQALGLDDPECLVRSTGHPDRSGVPEEQICSSRSDLPNATQPSESIPKTGISYSLHFIVVD